MRNGVLTWISNRSANDALRVAAARCYQFGFTTLLIFVLCGCAISNKPSSTTSAVILDPKKDPDAGFLIAKDAFGKATSVKTMRVSPEAAADAAASSAAFLPRVLLYASESTKGYLEAGSVNAVYRIQAWENLLKKYTIPFQIIAKPQQINNSLGGVLLLPSSIALSIQERQAIVNFRARGGSVLVTWAAGIRDEQGTWTGFEFMDQVLDTKIVGTSASDKTDNFLMARGDSPVNQALPAGQRIWTERASEWLPLRMQVKEPALHIMDWSRTFNDKRVTAVGHFTERQFGTANYSRVMALGIPERLWLTADPKHIEAIAHNSLNWLMRLPSVSKSAWPKQYESALIFAMDCAEVLLDSDVEFLGRLEQAGVRATLYILGDNAKKSADKIQALQQRGHELALAGDKFIGFSGQSAIDQSQRIDAALEKIKVAGLVLPKFPSFHAPTESYDKTTEAVIRQRGFTSLITSQDSHETRLPLRHRAAGSEINGPRITDHELLALVRTQRGPEDATEEGDVEEGLDSFYAELALAIQMRGLNVIRMPSQGLLTRENLQSVANELSKYQSKVWSATAGEVTQWWAERERVSVSLSGDLSAAFLNVDVAGIAPLKQTISLLVNLPALGDTVALVPIEHTITNMKITKLDSLRVSVELPALTPGNYRWQVRFLQHKAPTNE